MATVNRVALGKEFLEGILDKLPDRARAEMEAFLASGDATPVLETVGGGVARQSDYSRNMDQLNTNAKALQKWHDDLATYAKSLEAGGGDPTPTPVKADPSPTPTAGLSQEDVQSMLRTEFDRRETHYASFIADTATISARHQALFGEVLDARELMKHPKIAELGLEGAWRDKYATQLKASDDKIAAEARTKLEAEIREKVLAELGSRQAALPYAVDDTSPLAGLGGEANTYSPEAAAAMFNQLTAGRPS